MERAQPPIQEETYETISTCQKNPGGTQATLQGAQPAFVTRSTPQSRVMVAMKLTQAYFLSYFLLPIPSGGELWSLFSKLLLTNSSVCDVHSMPGGENKIRSFID